jgi:hypothetical protein
LWCGKNICHICWTEFLGSPAGSGMNETPVGYQLRASRRCLGRQLHSPRVSWDVGPTRCRPGVAPRDRQGIDAAHRFSARARKEVSAPRLVPVGGRASELCRDCAADGSVVSQSGDPEDTSQTWRGCLRTGDCTRGAGRRCRNYRLIRPVRCGHEDFAATIPTDSIQTMDAQPPAAVVAGAPAGFGNLGPLVPTGLVAQVNSAITCDCPSP